MRVHTYTPTQSLRCIWLTAYCMKVMICMDTLLLFPRLSKKYSRNVARECPSPRSVSKKNRDMSYEKRACGKQSRMQAMWGRQRMRDEAQMSNYVADNVRANRAGIKNLFQNPDGSSICVGTIPVRGHIRNVHSHDGTQRKTTFFPPPDHKQRPVGGMSASHSSPLGEGESKKLQQHLSLEGRRH